VVAAALVVIPRTSSAGGLLDDCVVRSIERAGDTLHVSLDIERSSVEQEVRAAAQQALPKFPGVTIGAVRLNLLDPVTLHIDADFTAKLQHGWLSLELRGTLGARVTLAVADGKAVRVNLAPDALSIGGQGVSLNGQLGSVPRQIDVPELGGQLESMRIAALQTSWIEVGIDVHAATP
jgi:hypothetical protein